MHKFILVPVMMLLTMTAFAADFDLNAFLREKLKSGVSTIVLPPGKLRVAATTVIDSSFRNLTITGNGQTELIMTRLTEAFFLRGCRNITFSGFSVDYDPLPFTQGTVESIDGNKITFAVHAGYPDLSAAYLVKHALFFAAADRNWRWEELPNHTVETKALSPRRGVITMGRKPQLAIGDYVVLNARSTTVFKLRDQAENITFRDLTIYSSPGAAFIARRTSGQHRFDRVVIRRGPLPAGASETRLLSTGADGINYGTCRQGPIIENCDLSFMGDDSVNFHGVTLPVIKRGDRDFTVALTYRPTDLGKIILPGDKVRILAPGNYRVLKTAELEAIEPQESIEDITPAKIASFYQGQTFTANGIPNYILYRIRLKGAVAEPGQFIDIPAVNGPGFVIRNSSFHDHRARGLRIQASNGQITGCKFKNLEQSAISIGAEYAFWMEAGWTSGIEIRDNLIENVCQGGISWSEYSYFPGAIAIFARNFGKVSYWPGNTAITIAGNTITGCPVSGIFILAGDNITISGNRIDKVNQVKAPDLGKRYGFRYQPLPIGIAESVNIHLQP